MQGDDLQLQVVNKMHIVLIYIELKAWLNSSVLFKFYSITNGIGPQNFSNVLDKITIKLVPPKSLISVFWYAR